ncbi:protein MET1, chloroplastic [Solanum lycopersicum]|uniref:protein MET1, chloroplastic n=1 Tax=Solanum lycopersicum TaxID=4081 RepID=UPI0002767FC2|nr:protein MET1, chloroplastic [Solanum lycopersicum]
MASAVVAGAASSSCSVSYSRNLSITKSNSSIPSLKSSTTPSQRTSFQGLSLQEAKRGVSNTFLGAESKRNATSNGGSRGLEITARKAAAAKNIEVEVDKPLGLTLGPKQGGGVLITGIDNGGNAARAGLKVGDQVVYTSSFFGDELWPADKLGFTKTAIQAKPDSVYFVISRGADVDVKRLPKRPAPPQFGRKLTDAQKARATHICLDCGYIYTLPKSFDEQPEDYACPQCIAPKKRFARYDVNTGRAIGGGLPPIGVIIGLIAGIGGVGALLVYGLQ